MANLKNSAWYGVVDPTADIAAVQTEADKIDLAAVDGLTGVINSLAYRVHEIERHLHSGARWFESAAAPVLETHIADMIGSGSGPFRLDAGNDAWGAWVQILGSEDTPTVVGKSYFDPHQVIIEDVERANTYFVQMTRGETGDAGFAAGYYSEWVYAATNTKDSAIMQVQTGRAPAGSKLWARCMCPGVDTGWMDIYFGLHEYEG